MEGIQSAVREVFPEMEKDLFDQLIERVKQLGAETTVDLEYLEAQDFYGILKPIQARKFLKMVVHPKKREGDVYKSKSVFSKFHLIEGSIKKHELPTPHACVG